MPETADLRLREDELVAVRFVTRDLLDMGEWRVFGHSKPWPIRMYLVTGPE